MSNIRFDGKGDRILIRAGLLAIPAIALVVNFLVLQLINPLALLMIEDEVLAAIDLLSADPLIRFLNQILPLILATAGIALALVPIYRAYFRDEIRRDARAARALLNAPVVVAAATGAGWLFGTPVVPLAAALRESSPPPEFAVQYWSHGLVLFFVAFLLSFFLAEALVRRVLAPRILKGEEALESGARLGLSIKARLFLLTFATFAVPALMFTGTIRVLNDAGRNRFGRDMMGVLEIGLPTFTLFALAVTWLKALSIATPLRQLREAAKRVGEGDFSVRAPVVARDELGELAGAFNAMTKGLGERELLRETFGKAVDPRVRDRLVEGGDAARGETRTATVVFLDLAGFTSLSEGLPPEKVVGLLNLYFEAATSCVEAEGGLVNKFIGDGVLAVFGVPIDLPGDASAALAALRALDRKMAEINRRLAKAGAPELRFRAGVHRGEVLAGVVGARRRLEYTVIGDAVNVASRLEQLGKEKGRSIIVSGAAAAALRPEEAAGLEPLGEATIRGRTAPLAVFAPRAGGAPR